jgi:hypothetical protein
MAESSHPSVSTLGSSWITIGWLWDQAARSKIDLLRNGRPAQKLGVARAAANNCAGPRLATKCAELLSGLVADSADGVQEAVSEFLREDDALRCFELRKVTVDFVASPAFLRQPSWLVRALRSYPESLTPLAPIVETVCRQLTVATSPVAQDASSSTSFDLQEFVPILLRLYEQAEQAGDRGLRTTCLNWWDNLIESKGDGALQLLARLDQGQSV